MRRTTTRDVELNGRKIANGEIVALSFVAGNYDDAVIERPNDFWIDRPVCATISRSEPVSIAVWVIVWLRCNCAFCGRKFCSALKL